MNISIQQYRVSIGMYNNTKIRTKGSLPAGNMFNSLFDKLNAVVTSAVGFLYYIIFTLIVINYMLDIFEEYINSTCTTNLNNPADTIKYRNNIKLAFYDYRIVLGCYFYCLLKGVMTLFQAKSSSSFKSIYFIVKKRLFSKKAP